MHSADPSKSKTYLAPKVILSPTLAADAMVAKLREEGRDVFHMGFGQAPFPTPQRMQDALRDNAHEKAYLPVAGLPALRKQVLHHQNRLVGTDIDDVDVLIAPGSKLIIYAAQMAIAGDLLLPAPSWVSYAPQAEMLGQATISVPTELSPEGMVITGEGLSRVIVEARAQGLNPSKILLNYPSNPTGLTIPDWSQREIAQVCVDHNITIIADEIYGRLTFAGGYRSIATLAPDHTIVTTGLSKHMSLGGWRLGVGIIPKSMSGLFDALSGIASETWSCVAAPIQIAAIEAYAGHDDIEAFVADSTAIHAVVTKYVAQGLRDLGVECYDAQGGFYVWPDFSHVVDPALTTSEALAAQLTRQQGIVTLPGTAFGMAPEHLRLRLSTCDYDGERALAFYQSRGGQIDVSDVAAFAPNVAGALAGFAKFVGEA